MKFTIFSDSPTNFCSGPLTKDETIFLENKLPKNIKNYKSTLTHNIKFNHPIDRLEFLLICEYRNYIYHSYNDYTDLLEIDSITFTNVDKFINKIYGDSVYGSKFEDKYENLMESFGLYAFEPQCGVQLNTAENYAVSILLLYIYGIEEPYINYKFNGKLPVNIKYSKKMQEEYPEYFDSEFLTKNYEVKGYYDYHIYNEKNNYSNICLPKIFYRVIYLDHMYLFLWIKKRVNKKSLLKNFDNNIITNIVSFCTKS